MQLVYGILIVLAIALGASSVVFMFSKSSRREGFATVLALLETILLLAYFVFLWIYGQRPPMKTLWETRYLFALCLAIVGSCFYVHYKYVWIAVYSFVLSAVFLILNLVRFENVDVVLPMALRSIWYVPHVVVYMFGYAFFGIAALLSVKKLIFSKYESIKTIDNMIYWGFACITFGIVIGALWAKNIWGGYWTWDAKELWALISWLSYLLYLHIRFSHRNKEKLAICLAIVAFLLVLFCWLGMNFILTPENSVHIDATK